MSNKTTMEVVAEWIHKSPSLTKDQKDQLLRLKQYFPYRIVWGCVNPAGSEFQCFASPDKRQMNKKIRAGWKVFQLN